MKILVTGFEPFNGETINPSREVALRLIAPKNTDLCVKILPVDFKLSEQYLKEYLDKEKPNAVISIGQNGIYKEITPEMVAINLDSTRLNDGKKLIKDSSGFSVEDTAIVENGPVAYFTNLAIRDMVKVIQETGVPAAVSYSAGTFVCNHTMYILLHMAATKYPDMKADFIHVPFLPEQIEGKINIKVYSMELDQMVTGIQAVINYLAADLD